jgi:hypothetical protein
VSVESGIPKGIPRFGGCVTFGGIPCGIPQDILRFCFREITQGITKFCVGLLGYCQMLNKFDIFSLF